MHPLLGREGEGEGAIYSASFKILSHEVSLLEERERLSFWLADRSSSVLLLNGIILKPLSWVIGGMLVTGVSRGW